MIHDWRENVAEQGVWQIESPTIISGRVTVHFLFSELIFVKAALGGLGFFSDGKQYYRTVLYFNPHHESL